MSYQIKLKQYQQKIIVSTKDINKWIYFTSNDGLQNLFVYQPTFSAMKYQNTNTKYVIGWKSKWVYVTDLVPIKSNSLTNIKIF